MYRIEGLDKLTGRERYLDDEPMERGDGEPAWWGMTVRSPAPRGRIVRVVFDGAVDWSAFTVVDHRDVPRNEVRFIECDMPVLAARTVRYVHEPVVLLAHPCRETLRRAAAAVRVEVDEDDPVLDYRVPPRPAQIQHGPDNVLKALRIEKGDVDAALRRAAHVVEGVYETGPQEHVYLETNAMEAQLAGEVLEVRGSMQCPYYVVDALVHALGRDETSVRVVQTPTGGGFGGKEDFPSVIALHAALLAMKSGRRVRIVYDRMEDMAATTKRHPSRVRHRTGLDRRGRLLAREIDVLMDGGAYVTLSPVVLSRGIIHAAGPYACDHVRIDGRTMLSNTVPYGAFRGFGAPQTLFACERHLDSCARAVGMDPVELRRVNLIRDGQSTATGQVIRDGADREKVLDVALALSSFEERRTAHRAFNATERWARRGIGVATFFHGAGFTGSGELRLRSRAAVAGLPDGRVEVRTANTEIGQGTATVLTRIAADHLDYPFENVVLAPPDTRRVPNSGPTVASRTVMVVGRLVERAADEMRRSAGIGATAPGADLADAIRAWHVEHPGAALVGEAEYEPPPGIAWDEKSYRGDAYGAFSWAAYVAEVEVDLRTYAARVIDFTAVQEVGKVVHETLARGQIQGGVVQAIGWALMEQCVQERGAMRNCHLTDYVIPTSADVPPIRVAFLEVPYAHGAQGAKGIGELSMDGPAPAIASAVADAIGVEPTVLPMTPERLMELVQHAHAG
jgi:CO/xanthine dehydrogenase Mo-binding subunit